MFSYFCPSLLLVEPLTGALNPRWHSLEPAARQVQEPPAKDNKEHDANAKKAAIKHGLMHPNLPRMDALKETNPSLANKTAQKVQSLLHLPPKAIANDLKAHPPQMAPSPMARSLRPPKVLVSVLMALSPRLPQMARSLRLLQMAVNPRPLRMVANLRPLRMVLNLMARNLHLPRVTAHALKVRNPPQMAANQLPHLLRIPSNPRNIRMS